MFASKRPGLDRIPTETCHSIILERICISMRAPLWSCRYVHCNVGKPNKRTLPSKRALTAVADPLDSCFRDRGLYERLYIYTVASPKYRGDHEHATRVIIAGLGRTKHVVQCVLLVE